MRHVAAWSSAAGTVHTRSAPDATPPSQNILGSPPKRDIAINPVQSNLSVHGESAGEYVHDAQGGVAIPSSRRKSDF